MALPINDIAFQACVDQVLVPELRPGDNVVMNNLGSHKPPGIRMRPSFRVSPPRRP